MKRHLPLAALIAALGLPLIASGQTCGPLIADKRILKRDMERLEPEMRDSLAQMKKMTAALQAKNLAATGYANWTEAKVAALRQVAHWNRLEGRRLALEERANKLEMEFHRAGCPW